MHHAHGDMLSLFPQACIRRLDMVADAEHRAKKAKQRHELRDHEVGVAEVLERLISRVCRKVERETRLWHCPAGRFCSTSQWASGLAKCTSLPHSLTSTVLLLIGCTNSNCARLPFREFVWETEMATSEKPNEPWLQKQRERIFG